MEPQVGMTPVNSPQPQEPSPQPPVDKIEAVVWLLFAGTVLFSFLIIGISKWSPNDGQTFQFLTTVGGGFAGALWTKITGRQGSIQEKQIEELVAKALAKGGK